MQAATVCFRAARPSDLNRATLPCRFWVALSTKVAIQKFLRKWIENSFNRLKDFRRLSLRLDKTDINFRGFLAFRSHPELAANGQALRPSPVLLVT